MCLQNSHVAGRFDKLVHILTHRDNAVGCQIQNTENRTGILHGHRPNRSAVIGCGISDAHDGILPEIFKKLNCPTVIDADGINFLARNKDVLRDAKLNAVFTPHPGEFGRLLNMDTEKINSDRVNLAVNFSRYHRCTLVLKGKNTIVATNGEQVFINDTGCSALAKGGSGDVLAGVIGALLAQGYDNHSAAVIGVHVHGKASEILSETYGESGVLPSDLPKMIGKLLG